MYEKNLNYSAAWLNSFLNQVTSSITSCVNRRNTSVRNCLWITGKWMIKEKVCSPLNMNPSLCLTITNLFGKYVFPVQRLLCLSRIRVRNVCLCCNHHQWEQKDKLWRFSVILLLHAKLPSFSILVSSLYTLHFIESLNRPQALPTIHNWRMGSIVPWNVSYFVNGHDW